MKTNATVINPRDHTLHQSLQLSHQYFFICLLEDLRLFTNQGDASILCYGLGIGDTLFTIHPDLFLPNQRIYNLRIPDKIIRICKHQHLFNIQIRFVYCIFSRSAFVAIHKDSYYKKITYCFFMLQLLSESPLNRL